MGDTTKIKKQIKDIVRILSLEYGTVLKEENVIKSKPDGLKYNGASEEKQICLFVIKNNKYRLLNISEADIERKKYSNKYYQNN